MNTYEESKETGRRKSDKDLSNAETIIFALKDHGHTISIAESITAGGLSYMLTRVPGSSAVFMGGMMVYTRETKMKFLNIPESVLSHGLVSPETSEALAKSIMEKFDTNIGVGITGNAGPTSNDADGSVGRVYLTIADKNGLCETKQFDFFGGRDDVRQKTLTEGLRALRNFVEREYLENK